jgi:hypothetical protein
MERRTRKKLGILAVNIRQEMGVVKTLKPRHDRNVQQSETDKVE